MIKRKKYTLLMNGYCLMLVLAMLNSQGLAQKTVFERDVKEQIERTFDDSTTGPNGKFFTHGTYSFGIILPINQNDSAAIQSNAKSNVAVIGTRYKFKLGSVVSLVLDANYMHQRYRIQQNEGVNIFSPVKRNSLQKLNFHTFGLGGYLRLNVAPRGNALGKYLDLGADIHYVLAERIMTKNDVDPALNAGAEELKVSLKKLDYTAKYQTFLTARIGLNTLALFAKYRISDLFVHSDNFYAQGVIPELPRLSIGFEFSVYDFD